MFVISPLYKHNRTKTTFGLQIYLPYDFLIQPVASQRQSASLIISSMLEHHWKKEEPKKRLRNWREDDYSTDK